MPSCSRWTPSRNAATVPVLFPFAQVQKQLLHDCNHCPVYSQQVFGRHRCCCPPQCRSQQWAISFSATHNTEEYHSRHFHDTLTKGFLGHRGKDFYRSRFRFEQSKKKYGNEDMCFEDRCAARFHRLEPLNANVL